MTGCPYAPMLATAGPLPAGAGWAFELKWDGMRAIAVADHRSTRLFARGGAEITAAYPELCRPGELVLSPGSSVLSGAGCSPPGDGPAGGGADVVLDGELVAFDPAGRPSFQALAQRMHVRDPGRAARLAATVPVRYLAFDLLRLGGVELLDRPYAERRALLEGLAVGGSAMVPPAFDDGPATLAASREHGLEGVVAKRLTSGYHPGSRCSGWVKVKNEQTGDFVVGGWRPGAREIGALLVGVPVRDAGSAAAGPAPESVPDQLVYRGRVGGGASLATQRALLAALRPLVVADSPFGGTVPRADARGATWVAPRLVVEVRFGNRTGEGRLRFPRLLRLRPDKPASDVVDD